MDDSLLMIWQKNLQFVLKINKKLVVKIKNAKCLSVIKLSSLLCLLSCRSLP